MRVITKWRRLGSFALAEINFFFFIEHYLNAFIGFTHDIPVSMVTKWLSCTQAAGAPGIHFARLHFYDGRLAFRHPWQIFIRYHFHAQE
jgi:hypothetical protein